MARTMQTSRRGFCGRARTRPRAHSACAASTASAASQCSGASSTGAAQSTGTSPSTRKRALSEDDSQCQRPGGLYSSRASSSNPITIRGPGHPFGFLSNLWRCRVLTTRLDDGTTVTGRSVENLFQQGKFRPDTEGRAQLAGCSPRLSAKRGLRRRWASDRHRDWDVRRLAVMRAALRTKFEDTRLQHQLLQTGECLLVERSQPSRYWGDGGDGRGKNMLGILLMELRGQLRSQRQQQRTGGAGHGAARSSR